MVKNVNLTNFDLERSKLLATINRKIIATKVSNVNEVINKKLKVDLNTITNIVSGIEYKFRKCEMIYTAYFENVDHDILSGNSSTLPFQTECIFTESTSSFSYSYRCDDKSLYKEVIDMNFQNFILMISSIYESLVHLSEIVLRKVIVHHNSKAPISSPLDNYIDFLRILISLGYRKNDDLNMCITSFDPYFQQYLKTINLLRNSFIHGHSTNLSSDGYNYKVNKIIEKDFIITSPLLDIDAFTQQILDKTKAFILALYPVLERGIRHHKKFIPA